MIDPHKFDYLFQGCTPGTGDIITHMEVMLERTKRYDEMFPWFDKEVCEKFASLDQLYLNMIINVFKDPATEAILEATYHRN
ncbi:MAG: hypothetical protein IJW16_07625 [Clostridia bacterium]|nr:hypothetical protein [Clostridia bacterium]